jgi:hypothetical protein
MVIKQLVFQKHARIDSRGRFFIESQFLVARPTSALEQGTEGGIQLVVQPLHVCPLFGPAALEYVKRSLGEWISSRRLGVFLHVFPDLLNCLFGALRV